MENCIAIRHTTDCDDQTFAYMSCMWKYLSYIVLPHVVQTYEIFNPLF